MRWVAAVLGALGTLLFLGSGPARAGSIEVICTSEVRGTVGICG